MLKCRLDGIGISSAIVSIKNTEINSNGSGISVNSNATVNIGEGVNIVAKDSGIYMYSGTINVGEKDGVVNYENIIIEGKTYGIYNYTSAIVNFYDGKVIGEIDKSVYGGINDVEEGYTVTRTVEDTKEIAKLEAINSFKVVETNMLYATLQEAIDDINTEEKQTIQVLNNKIIPGTEVAIIPNEKNISLDLNGYKLELGGSGVIDNSGTLEITDSSEDKAGIITMFSALSITNEEGATLEINGGTITGSKANSTMIENKGTMQIKGGTIQTNNNNITMISNAGTLQMDGGMIQSANSSVIGIKNQEEGNVTINNGIITLTSSSSSGITNAGTGEVIIAGGEITTSYSNSRSITNIGAGNITITGGIIKSLGYAVNNNGSGTVMVRGGTITSTNYDGIYNYSTGTVTVTGGIVTSTGSNSPGISNYSTGTVTVIGGIVTSTGSNSSGIYNYSTGTVTVIGGTVTSTGSGSYGIRNNSTGTIVIGEKDGNVSTSIPEIKAIKYGIYNDSTGIVNFYDGIIIGNTNQSIYGSINEIEEEYEIVKTNDEVAGTETAKLEQVASTINTTTNTEYYNIQKAITEAEEGDTLQVLRNIVTLTTQDSIVVETDKDIVLDLNGYNINFGQVDTITNKGKLSIVDSSTEKTGSIINTVGKIITNEEGATLEINGGTITGSKANSTMIENKGTMQIKGGTIQTNNNNITMISNIGTLQMNGGMIESSNYSVLGIKNQEEGNVTINNGTITLTSYSSTGITNAGTGEVIIAGGEITTSYSNSKSITNIGAGNITITGGTIKSNSNAVENTGTGTVTIDNGIITANTAIYNNGSCSIIVNGGTLTSTSTVINNYNKGSILVTGGTITSTGGYDQGINNYGEGNITVTGGTITATGNYSYGIYNNSTGTITIGEKDGNVSASVPEIKAIKYGIYNNSTGIVNFYDGIIKGDTQAINGTVKEVESDYEIRYSENNTIATLQLINTGVKSISIGSIYYDTLQTAVNASVDGDVITLWADIILDNTIEIPEGRNIIIELNGYNITGNNLDVLINNRGTVNIQDSIGTGSISNPNGETIVDVN